jgi:hypothetical protein
MISQTVRNEFIRFVKSVNKQISYKILRLEVLKFCTIHLALNSGCFEVDLMKNTPRTLGVNILPLVKVWN